MFRRALALALLIVMVAILPADAMTVPRGAPPDASRPPKLEPALAAKLQIGTTGRYVVEFKGQADLSKASGIKDSGKRGKFVLDALTATARSSQAEAIKLVHATKGARAMSYWLTNVLVVTGDADLAKKLAARSEVLRVRTEKVYPVVQPVSVNAAVLAAGGAPEWNVSKIGADKVWAAGDTGSGVVVATIDTGVDYTHPAIVNQYRGNLGGGTFDHNYNWWDPSGMCGGAPCDNAGHGTHTMGTIVGGDGAGPFTPDTGVAPGAQWIAAKGCEDMGCSESSLLSSGQFVLAPTDLNGQNPDPSRRPQVVSNSWGGGSGDTFYQQTVQAWRAAGIIPVFSAGNSGPSCGSANSPGDYPEVLAVGATDSNDIIAEFSSRGPSLLGKVDPDVSAPGVNVTSSVPGGGYQSYSGTSMAAPHVAGTIALLLSAKPSLIGDFDGVAGALGSTALDRIDTTCGGAESGDPNNVYGNGRIDAEAAFQQVKTGGTLEGTIIDAETRSPIAGARIVATKDDRAASATTDSAGHYMVMLGAGTYSVTAEAFGYAGKLAPAVEIVANQTTTQNLELSPVPRYTVSGHVTGSEDGSPVAAVTVRAIGVPVPAVQTDASGAYSLQLPAGMYTLEARAGGCTESATAPANLSEGAATVDFSLYRKLDNAGHGCSAISLDWIQADGQTALYGDGIVGRLRLPFAFPFYGKSYDQIYLSDDGYLSFQPIDPWKGSFPAGIPSSTTPNAAIYALWQDLYLDDSSSVSYSTVGSTPNRAFVIEYDGVKGNGGSSSIEVKLWEDGKIDLLYGDQLGEDGRNGVVGIEDEAGTDALQFSLFEPVLTANSAYRFEHVPTGLVHGVVTDRNDGLPIAGATVTTMPGGRSVTTAADGSYNIVLRPGNYSVAITARGYLTAEQSVTVADGGDLSVDADLAAPVAVVGPASIAVETQYGTPATATLTLTNPGTAPLSWSVMERDRGVALPELPTLARTYRNATWGPAKLPVTRSLAHVTAIPPALLDTVVTDPEGDAQGNVDVVAIRGGSDNSELSVAIDFSSATAMNDAVGYLFFDTDQNASTGLPPEFLYGSPAQDIGFDFFADLFYIHDSSPVVGIWDASFQLVAMVPVRIEGHTVAFDVPLAALGGDDGNVNVASIVGNVQQPTDWAPDAGHGTISGFRDAPWMSEIPESGTLDPGASTTITVNLGSVDQAPGLYQGALGLVTSAPKQQGVIVPVEFTVTVPAEFGAVAGAATDAHRGKPLAATVTLHAEWQGAPLDVVAKANADGTYTIFGPEGTWPIEYSLDGYVSVTNSVTIARGGKLAGQNVQLHAMQPHAALSGGPVQLVLTPGRTGHRTITLSNPGGHKALTFQVGEVDLTGASKIAAASGPATLPAGADPNARTTKGLTGRPTVTVPASVQGTGDVLAAWPTNLAVSWGVGYDGSPWIGDPSQLSDNKFTVTGAPLASFATPWAGAWAADMAHDPSRGWIWQVNVGGDNGIYGLDPSDGSVKATITGSPWTNTSQRGLAYDPASDTFYIGGWNEGIVYHVAGLSWATPGETLGQCTPPDPNISGLAWNPSFRMLWEATNSDTDNIYLLDPATCEAKSAIPHPEQMYAGAGIEMDDQGNLWTVSQASNTAYLLDSGLPNFADVPWLSVTPASGSVATDGSLDLDVAVDTTGLAPGIYRAAVVVTTDDPDNRTFTVPVVLIVPAYQQGVNTGGPSYVNGNGDQFAPDQAYSAGSFGWLGGSSVRKTQKAIAGTTDDPLYQDQREGMSGYRFDLANGHYRVDLSFADLLAKKAGTRVFSVSIEGQTVLSSFDVYAAAGGANTACDRSFEVDVTDGHLDIGFTPQRGDKPIVNGILVTEIPGSFGGASAPPRGNVAN